MRNCETKVGATALAVRIKTLCSTIQAPENQRIVEPSEESSSSASSSSTSREGPLTSQSLAYTGTGHQKPSSSPLAFSSTSSEDEIRLATDQPTAKPTTDQPTPTTDQLSPTLSTMQEVKEEKGSK